MVQSLFSVGPKLARIPKHIEAIQRCIDTYSACNPAKFITDAQRKTTVDLSTPPPIEIAVLIGECIYQMRSTLDHLAFDLVKFNPTGIALPTDWEDNCQFPIWTRPLVAGQIPPLPYGRFKNLPGITVKAHTFIESIQPYYGTGEVNNSLKFINDLCNIDKHRHLALTRGRSQISESRLWTSGKVSTGYTSVDHGTEIDVIGTTINGDVPVEVDFAIATLVTFNESILGNAACKVPVQAFLQLMLDSVNIIAAKVGNLMSNP